MSSVKAKRLKPPKVCIFCGGNKVTGEHLWPDWAAPLFDLAPRGTTELYQSSVPESPVQVRKRQGHVVGRKIYAVCGPCNNVWMSQLEAGTKPILMALAAAEEVGLDANAQSLLAHWVTLKMMVVEHTKRDQAVFTQRHRDEFVERGVIPDDLNIWLFRCGKGHWRSAYQRHARVIKLIPRSDAAKHLNSPEGPPTAHSIALGFNELYIYANFTVEPRLKLDFEAGVFGVRLWPPTGGTVHWPPKLTLDAAAGDAIAATLSRFTPNAPVVMRMPVEGRFS